MSQNPVYMPKAGAGRNQAMRTALALSAYTTRPLRLGGLMSEGLKPRPGLGPGGYTAAAAAAVVSGGRFRLDNEGSDLELWPQSPKGGEYFFDVAQRQASAAPLSLVLETIVLPLSAAADPSHVILSGGTHVYGGFTSEEISQVLIPNLGSIGFDLAFREISPGFHPRGGGEAEITVKPALRFQPMLADKPFQASAVGIEVLTSGLPGHLAEQALEGALSRLELHRIKAKGRIRQAKAGPGSALLIWAQGSKCRVGFSILGRKGGRPSALANDAAEPLLGFLRSGAGITAAQAAKLLAPLACAPGDSRLTVDRLSGELRAAIEAVEAFFPGTVRIGRQRPQQPVEIRILGRARR